MQPETSWKRQKHYQDRPVQRATQNKSGEGGIPLEQTAQRNSCHSICRRGRGNHRVGSNYMPAPCFYIAVSRGLHKTTMLHRLGQRSQLKTPSTQTSPGLLSTRNPFLSVKLKVKCHTQKIEGHNAHFHWESFLFLGMKDNKVEKDWTANDTGSELRYEVTRRYSKA